jgi:ADP-ribosylglycohydrolase
MSEATEHPKETAPDEALFTVVAGEGDGFLLGLAAGDTAGGAWDLGYSAATEQATVIAYELIADGRLDLDRVVAALLEMEGMEEEEPVFRAESPEFRAWLDRARSGSVAAGTEPSLDAASRAAVLGVAFRRDPSSLVDETIALARLFHEDAGTVASAVVSAAAVAASCFAQSGLDLVAGVGETVELAAGQLVDLRDQSRLESLPQEIQGLIPHVGVTSAEEAIEATGGDRADPLQMVLAGVLLAAPVAPRHHVAISEAAGLGGSRLGAMVGAVVGARVGIRAWPWAFANDTWFAEIGRRLVRGPNETRDLPIPYAVEQHLMSGGRPGFH